MVRGGTGGAAGGGRGGIMAAFNSTPSYKSDDRKGRGGTRVDRGERTDGGAVDLVSHIHCISIHPNPDYNILTSGTNGHLNLNGRTMRTIFAFLSRHSRKRITT